MVAMPLFLCVCVSVYAGGEETEEGEGQRRRTTFDAGALLVTRSVVAVVKAFVVVIVAVSMVVVALLAALVVVVEAERFEKIVRFHRACFSPQQGLSYFVFFFVFCRLARQHCLRAKSEECDRDRVNWEPSNEMQKQLWLPVSHRAGLFVRVWTRHQKLGRPDDTDPNTACARLM